MKLPRLAFTGRVDEQRKHLADAVQLIAQFGDVGGREILFNAPHGCADLTLRTGSGLAYVGSEPVRTNGAITLLVMRP